MWGFLQATYVLGYFSLYNATTEEAKEKKLVISPFFLKIQCSSKYHLLQTVTKQKFSQIKLTNNHLFTIFYYWQHCSKKREKMNIFSNAIYLTMLFINTYVYIYIDIYLEIFNITYDFLKFYFRIYVAQASTEVTILLSQSMKIAAVCPHV